MQAVGSMVVARQLEAMGVNIVREGFATWVREDLGFQASDEHVDRALNRVQDVLARGHTTLYDLTCTIAAEMPRLAPDDLRVDAFGGSAWTLH